MKLDCVITACDANPLYMDFIPIFVKTWNKLYPNIDVKIVLISNDIPHCLQEYTDNIILFEPISGMSTAFTSQYIRLLYPAILDYENGIMITDMDILPMNRTYYTENIANIEDNKFIYLRNVLLRNRQIAMCYNVATNKTWSDVFKIHTLLDIREHLASVYSSITYVDGHNKAGWSTDQVNLYKRIMSWNTTTGNFVSIDDNVTGFRRLDRNQFTLSDTFKKRITSGHYSDYHCYRPYSEYKDINDKIYEIL